MIIKDVSELSNLYDLSGLSLIDYEGQVIIADINSIEQDTTPGAYNLLEKISMLIRNSVKEGSKIKTGDIVLVTNEDSSRKIYCLISVVCGQVVPYVLYEVNYESGNEVIANFTRSDIEMLMQYPMFQDSAELIFFITKMKNVFAENAATDNRSLIQNIKTYLDKGLWAAYVDGHYSKPEDIAAKLGLRRISDSDVLYEKDGKYLAFYDNNIYGSYDLVKAAFCEIADQPDVFSSLIYTTAFGALFNKNESGIVMSRLVDFENDIKLLSAPKTIVKTEEQATEEIVKGQEQIKDAPITIEEDFFSKAEQEFIQAEKETKKQKKKKREESFQIQTEVSQQEKDLAIKETIMKQQPKIVVPKTSRKKQIAAADKAIDKLLNAPADSFPADWDYVYTIEETSRFYNLTAGMRYDYATDKLVQDDRQTKGMSIEEWNAYFRAHPELSHLIEPTIGALGGLFIDEKTLIESGLLMYNPKKMKFDYVHEYIVGNVYKLIEDFEAIKDGFIQAYGAELYDKQLEALLEKRPPIKSITAADPKDVPYIHPLDEVIVDYKINSAANITFYNNQNNAIMNAEKKRLEAEIKAGNIDRKDYDLLIEEFGGKLQYLSIVVFFREWLTEQIGKLAAYGLPDIQLVDSLYFFGMSYNSYAFSMVERGLVIVPQGKEPKDVVTYSDYFESKDSAKRFVNELFQDFLVNQIREEDRKNIEYAWNKRYNGYVTADVWKLPIFIRHSKYFKDRTRRNKLKLSDVQVTGIKFATIDNSSIMAHEVGYGKTLVSIGYMSHCFETGQASNFLVNIPKTLYVNRKWREEIAGNFDAARNRYIIGAVPIYNIIELGNFSTSEIWGDGESKYKTYSEEDVDKINRLVQIFNEIGGRQAGKKTSKSQGTATIPKNAYNFRLAVANSNYAWSKIIDKILPELDKPLFNRSAGRVFPENKAILDLMSGFNIGTSAKDKQQNLGILSEKIIDLRWLYQKHLVMFPDVDFKGYAAYDENTRKQFERFRENQLPSLYEKDEKGRVVWETIEYIDNNNNKQVKDIKKPRPLKQVYEEFIISVLEDLHGWIEGIIQKMSDFAIYEYGQWKFNSGSHNIILSTKEALQNLGFSSSNITGIVEVVKEITTYKHEENYDIEKAYTVTYEEDGNIKQFRRDPEKVLQKQLNDMISKISNSMTEEGPRGKFFLDNLKIDGFILDEAHIAKKIFNNVKTNAFLHIDLAEGKTIAIKTTSHDIKGVAAPETALAVFGICQYIRSIGNRKPIMLLTATPFSNQPTEIFSMLSLVGINQLREYGISNIKNFFDLFLKETLKFDFDHSGDFIKRITVEDFRNKELLINLIWSVMDIRRESSLDKTDLEERQFGDKPIRKVFPKLVAESSMETVKLAEEDEDLGLNECEQLGNVGTIAVVNKLSLNTCSIVDQNDVQKKMLADIEKVVSAEINPNTNLEYTFDDICPNAAIYNEIEKEKAKVIKSDEEEERDSVTVALRTILNTNIKQIPNGVNVPDYEAASIEMPNMQYGDLIFVENDKANTGVGKWGIYRKVRVKRRSQAYDILEKVTDQDKINETLKELNKKKDYGVTFKALGISRAIALSPYYFRCNELPEPTPENVIKYSPKLEYLVKALKSVKDYHINEIPVRIKDLEDELKEIESKKKLSSDDEERRSQILKELPQLNAAKEVSGQVVYMNMIRFNYYSRTEKGKATVTVMNMAELLKEYLLKKGWFAQDEVQVISSETKDSTKEQYIKDFQDGKIKVLFGTPAIKEGVDLQNKASTMYIMTPDWNPTDMRQIEGRIWRRDNENKFVRIVYVLLDQSVEVFIYAKLEEKARRLQQIMKERNTIAELEEMSLNPNETKVALASDPEKRADIVTKLCQAVLFDQRNKINKNREEVNRLNADLDTIYQNIEIIKDNYLIPYHEVIPKINQKYYDHQMQSAVNLWANDKSRFVDKFAEYTVGEKNRFWVDTYAQSSPVLKDDTLSLALMSMTYEVSIDALLYFITTTDNNVLQDILNGLQVGIENRDAIVKDAIDNHSGSISWNTIMEYMPMMHSTNMNFRMIEDYLTGKYNWHHSLRYFKLPYVLFAYTDNMREQLLSLIKEIKEKQAKGSIHKYDIRDMFQSLSVVFNKELRDYAMTSPLVKPENYWPYIEARDLKAASKVLITSDKFDALDLFQKIKWIQDLYEEIDKGIAAFAHANVDTRRDIIAGKNKTPVKSEFLVALGLANEDKTMLGDIRNQMEELFRPVLRIKNVLQEVEVTFLKAHGMTIDDLPMLAQKQNEEYDAITQKINELEKSRQKLIERFRKAAEQRKSVTIDQIVASFAKSNTYLEKKLFRQNV